jgi:hypothetical protein
MRNRVWREWCNGPYRDLFREIKDLLGSAQAEEFERLVQRTLKHRLEARDLSRRVKRIVDEARSHKPRDTADAVALDNAASSACPSAGVVAADIPPQARVADAEQESNDSREEP